MLSTLTSWVPWAIFCFGMFVTFCVIYVRESSFRKALLGALFVGKTFAIVYWVAGLNKTVVTLYIINKKHLG